MAKTRSDPSGIDAWAFSNRGGARSGKLPMGGHHGKRRKNKPVLATPRDLEELGETLGIKIAQELYLLPVLAAAFEAGLPQGWEKVSMVESDTHVLDPFPHSSEQVIHRLVEESKANGGHKKGKTVVVYKHSSSGQISTTRPIHAAYKDMIVRHRQAHYLRPLSEVGSRPWMKFTKKDGTHYFYNFKTRVSADTMPEQRSSDTDTLRFTTWWHYQSHRHYVHIAYRLRTHVFEIHLDHDPHLYVVSRINGPKGPLEAMDLHINAKINVLGRPMTLFQCDLPTTRWLADNVTSALEVKSRLEEELGKYTTTAVTPRVQLSTTPAKKAELSLRTLLEQINSLRQTLVQFRPRLAFSRKFQVQLNM